MGVFGLAHPLLSLFFYNYVFFIRKLLQIHYIKRIFDCILATGFKHMFSRFLVKVPLKTIFVKKIESLGKKI